MSKLHGKGWNGDDRTLCGIAAEGECSESDDCDPPPVFARSGEEVTCQDCRRLIAHCKAHYSVDFRVLRS
jgi:hypothetical protein